mmetsp:Transcript_14448/g.31296  ORF Transcript_14448/g.31296 Transcript_14448/m.31296 type:complete len:289 (+) Transcript_14448:1431-2297(+)
MRNGVVIDMITTQPQNVAIQPSQQPKTTVAKNNAVPSEAETRAQKRQLELIGEDCKRVCTGDINRGFSDLGDALDRLLPYHVLGAAADSEADVDDTLDQPGATLLFSREFAWSDLMLRDMISCCRQAEHIKQKLDSLEQRYSSGEPLTTIPKTESAALARLTKEDAMVLERFMHADAKQLLEAEKAKPRDYQSSDENDEYEEAPNIIAATAVTHAAGAPPAASATTTQQHAATPPPAIAPAPPVITNAGNAHESPATADTGAPSLYGAYQEFEEVESDEEDEDEDEDS